MHLHCHFISESVGLCRDQCCASPLPIIHQEVVFVSMQGLPHVVLERGLLVHWDALHHLPLQLPEHGPGLGFLLVHHQEAHILQPAPDQLVTQVSQTVRRPDHNASAQQAGE